VILKPKFDLNDLVRIGALSTFVAVKVYDIVKLNLILQMKTHCF